MRSIKECVRELCDVEGISLTTLEERAGISNGSIGRWVTQSPKVETIVKVADYFKVPLDDLLDRKLIVGKEKYYVSDKEIDVIRAYRELTDSDKKAVDVLMDTYKMIADNNAKKEAK